MVVYLWIINLILICIIFRYFPSFSISFSLIISSFFCLRSNLIKPCFIIFTKNFFSDIDIVIVKNCNCEKHILRWETWYLSPSSKIPRYSRNLKILCTRVDMMVAARVPTQIHDDVDQRTFPRRLETNFCMTLMNIKATSCNEIKDSRRKHGLDRFCLSTGIAWEVSTMMAARAALIIHRVSRNRAQTPGSRWTNLVRLRV